MHPIRVQLCAVPVVSAEGVEWPEEELAPPEDARELITLLLQHNSVERLGSGGAHEVKEHVFYDGISWHGLLRQKAEFVPQLEHDEDTSYFDSTSTLYCHHSGVIIILYIIFAKVCLYALTLYPARADCTAATDTSGVTGCWQLNR